MCGASNARASVITNVMVTLSNFSKHLTKVSGTNKDYIGWKVSQASANKGAAVGFCQGSLLRRLHLLLVRSATNVPTQSKVKSVSRS